MVTKNLEYKEIKYRNFSKFKSIIQIHKFLYMRMKKIWSVVLYFEFHFQVKLDYGTAQLLYMYNMTTDYDNVE